DGAQRGLPDAPPSRKPPVVTRRLFLCLSDGRAAGHRLLPLLSHARSAESPLSESGRIAQLVEQLTLNHRVQGSSPCAPTDVFNHLADFDRAVPTSSRALIPTNRLVLFLMQAAFEADDPNADTEPKISVILRSSTRSSVNTSPSIVRKD